MNKESKPTADDLALAFRWGQLLNKLEKLIGKRPENLDSVLFLIGVQELGQGPKNFSKEEKQDLMHIAICRVLSKSGFYELEGSDKEGWPCWKLIKPLPQISLTEQEKVLKMHIIDYFEDEQIT